MIMEFTNNWNNYSSALHVCVTKCDFRGIFFLKANFTALSEICIFLLLSFSVEDGVKSQLTWKVRKKIILLEKVSKNFRAVLMILHSLARNTKAVKHLGVLFAHSASFP